MVPQQHTLKTPYLVGPVHCYTATIGDDPVLFDTGPPTPEARNYLQRHLDLKHLRHVIISHCHIDHYGLAHWLEQKTDATIYLPFRDSLKIERHEQRLQLMYELLQFFGFSNEFLSRFAASMEDGSVFPTLPTRYRIIEDDLPPHLGIEVTSCPGHSQSDLVLAGATWAVTGDVLLRGIFQSPLLDVDLLSGERFRNYDAYCATLLKLAGLRDKTILPGHRYSIESVDTNIIFYVTKLLERGAKVKQIDPARSVAEVAQELLAGKPCPPFAVYLKASELVFIRDFLAQPDALRRALETIGLFSTVSDLYHAALAP
ncbi:MBL fold metallo-hydrolase [Pelovirga terrestris]|uniref:MBL fold metallo-hydrolase n=1 Tax=Pelovirga terrestris TaxID=2771352 RepID=A0A8J6UQY4_9BACT|nr:MBL fold metallo-hydrolase [Pelovirga terrestris]MBD1400021.1 MBL fold metallo-hydrolase [Pelovirga terrestris]